jgi:hypothetical protein
MLERVQSTSIGVSSPEKENPAGAYDTAGPDDLEISHAVSKDLAQVQQQFQFSNDEERIKAIADGKYMPGRGEVKAEPVDIAKAQPIADVIKLARQEPSNLAVTALPVVRHWLFAPNGTRLKYREFTNEVSFRGRELVQRVCIGDKLGAAVGQGYGVLTARHQRALFAIQNLWQKQGGRLASINGKRFGSVCCSSYQVEEMLFGTHGGRQKEMVRLLVQQLASIPVKIENYVEQDGQVSTLDVTGLIHGRFASSRRVADGQLGFPWIEMVIDPVLVNAFERNDVKPIDLEVLASFKSDVAAILYPKIDHHLSTHRSVELRLDGLVEKLGLTDKQLGQLAYRLKKFREPLSELDGKPTSSGGAITVDVQPTADGEDWKLVAKLEKQ